jgi:hypothetical protein
MTVTPLAAMRFHRLGNQKPLGFEISAYSKDGCGVIVKPFRKQKTDIADIKRD